MPRDLDNSATAAEAPWELSTKVNPELGGAADVVKADSVDARTRGCFMWRRSRFIFGYESCMFTTIVVRIGGSLSRRCMS